MYPVTFSSLSYCIKDFRVQSSWDFGNFKESPAGINAKQASRIYTTPQLLDMMQIICETLPTDVTPNTLETIFIDLIPDFLPNEFLIEQAFKIYGHVNFPVDVEKKLTLKDLDQAEQMIVNESVEKCLNKVNDLGIAEECRVIKNYVEEKYIQFGEPRVAGVTATYDY